MILDRSPGRGPSVVFLRAVNVGGTNRCQPALIAKQLARFDIINIGAVGTFVVSKDVSESVLRAAIARKLPFKCEIMIFPARDLIKLTSKDPFAGQPSGPNITRFVSVAAKPLRARIRSGSHQTSNLKSAKGRIRRGEPQTSQLPPIPLSLPSDDDWLLKVIAIQGRCVLGLYRREMKAISYLGKIEKLLGVAVTTRSWNTIQKIAQILNKR
ncbi:MAG: hypothetical protein QOE26_1975 [Verrucomicrobiota bacterium]